MQYTQDDISQITCYEMLFHIFGEKLGYFSRKKSRKKLPSKRTRQDIREQVHKILNDARVTMMVKITQRIREEL